MVSDDWCADGKKMVDEGSDGIWLRVGPPKFRITCNPCVSVFSTILLFGWVIFCMAWTPGKYCLSAGTQTMNVSLTTGTYTAEYSSDKMISGPYNLGNNNYAFTVERQIIQEADCYVPRKEFSYWMAWVTYTSTWLYISTQDVWIVFLFIIIFSKYGKLKLGRDDDTPEFSNIEWFAMIFCCGVATGLFYFSVGEPINHYEPCGKWAWSGPDATGKIACKGTSGWANRYSHLPDNERAQAAMSLTFYHWGLHGWVCYAVVGCLLGILHFRKGLPMTMKSCFYPLIGTRVYGFWGDFIDVVSIVCTTFGVCTSLGMGVQQINAGLTILNGGKNWMGTDYFGVENQADWYDNHKESAKNIWESQKESWRLANPWGVESAAKIAQRNTEVSEQMLLIWIITLVSTGSICTGLNVGVKWLSIIALVLGAFLLWIVLALDDTWFIMNLFVQTIGHYLQYITEIGTYTGAFDQAEHGAPDGRQEYGPPSGAGWMNDWTIFYWGWWISWAPFCGVFLARISKGRTVREFLVTCIVITVTYNFIWMTVWGGAALKMEMSAEKAGIDCSSGYTKNYCRQDHTVPSGGYGRYSSEPLYFCSSVTRLSCHYFDYPPMMFDVVNQYSDLGPFLSVIIIIALFLYFITSSDSGSLVDSMVSANGMEEPGVPQRVWWSLTEGLSATGLLYSSLFDVSDPRSSMKALQAASIAAGLPYTFLVCFMCVALWKALKSEMPDPETVGLPRNTFPTCVLDFGITLYSGTPGPDLPLGYAGPRLNKERIITAVKFLFCPFLGLKTAFQKLEMKKSREPGAWQMIVAASVGIVCYYMAWLLIILDAIPIKAGGYNEFGVWNGTYNVIPDKISNRYGHFRLYSNSWKAGEVVVKGTDMWADHKEDMATGDRVGMPMHFAVFGWFFFLCFVSVVSALRASTREAVKIAGNAFEDFLCSLFLWPTVILQVNEALDLEFQKL